MPLSNFHGQTPPIYSSRALIHYCPPYAQLVSEVIQLCYSNPQLRACVREVVLEMVSKYHGSFHGSVEAL